MTKALVFGGAFNPPTKAHIQLADYARKQMHYDKVIFVPSKMTYIQNEQLKDFAFADEARLNMLNQVAFNHTWMEVCDFEIKSKEQPRTYTTLCYLKEQGYTCQLLFGSDKLVELENGWMHIEEICKEFGIVCMVRNNDDCMKMIQSNAYLRSISRYITLIDTPDTFQSVSSSRVRKLIEQSRFSEAEEWIPDELDIQELVNEK